MAKRALFLLALLGGLYAAVSFQLTDLLAWTDRMVPVSRYPALFAAYFATWLVMRLFPHQRRAMLLAGSLACAAIFDLPFLVLLLAWLAVFYRVLFSGRRIRFAVGFVVASFVLLALACDDGVLVWGTIEIRAGLADSSRWAYLFAVGWALRIVSLLHQVHVHRGARIPIVDFVLYFVFAPFYVIVPYCLAIPRCDVFRAGLDRHDTAIERSGLKMVAWGIVLVLVHAVLARVYDAQTISQVAAARGDFGLALVHGFVRSFVHAVLVACAMAAIVVGLVRVLGIDLGPSMNMPLLATSVVEWWRRWNTHFRDLLVDVFYYPVVMRLRRKKTLAIVAGAASVFVVGSTLLHWPKHYFRTGTWWPLGSLSEDIVMFAMVAVVMLRERAKTPRPLTWWRRAVGSLGAFLMVYIAVVVIGYSVAHVTLGRW